MTGYEITILALLIGIFLFCAWAVLLLYGLVGMKEIQHLDGLVLRRADEASYLNGQRLDFLSSKLDALSQSIDARLASNARKARRQRELEVRKWKPATKRVPDAPIVPPPLIVEPYRAMWLPHALRLDSDARDDA